MDLKEVSKQIHENARNKGFWDEDRNLGEMLILIVGEVSEAMEADRKDHYANRKGFEADMEGWSEEFGDYERKFKAAFDLSIKDSFEDELADTMIRIMDLAYSKDIDLEWHIKMKMRYNEAREHMHGKKY